jgi:hypothetical protein
VEEVGSRSREPRGDWFSTRHLGSNSVPLGSRALLHRTRPVPLRQGNRILCVSRATGLEHWFEADHLKPFLKGSLDIRRYGFSDSAKYLIFPYHNTAQRSILIPADEYAQRHPLTWPARSFAAAIWRSTVSISRAAQPPPNTHAAGALEQVAQAVVQQFLRQAQQQRGGLVGGGGWWVRDQSDRRPHSARFRGRSAGITSGQAGLGATPLADLVSV